MSRIVSSVTIVLLLSLSGTLCAQDALDYLSRGDRFYDADQLDSARHFYELALTDKRADTQLRAYTSLVKLASNARDFAGVDSLADRAEPLASATVVSDTTRLRYRAMLAASWSNDGQYRRSINALLRITEQQRAIGAWQDLALANKDIALNYQRMYVPDSSILYIERAHDLLTTRTDTTTLDYVYFLNDMGAVYYRADQLGKAEAYWLRNMAGLRAAGQHRSQRMAQVLDNIANVYAGRPDDHLVAEYRERALEILREIGDTLGYAKTLYNLGIYHYGKGDFGTAAHYVATSLATRERIVGVGHPSLINNYHAQGVLQTQEGNDAEALASFRRILPLVRASAGSETNQVARFLDEIGGAHRRLGRLDSARFYLGEAIRVYRKNARGGTHSEAIARHNLSLAASEGGDPATALSEIETALKILENLNLTDQVNYLQFGVARAAYLVDAGRLSAGRSALANILPRLRNGDAYKLDPEYLDALGQAVGVRYAIFESESTGTAWRNFTTLESDYLAATETARRQFFDPYAKGILSKQRNDVVRANIDRYARAHVGRGEPGALERLYALSEFSKATVVRDALSNDNFTIAGLPDSINAERQEYQRQIESQYYAAESAEGSQADSLRAELLSTRRAYDAFTTDAALRYPNQYSLQSEPNILARPQVQGLLEQSRKVAVVYLRGLKSYYALILGPDPEAVVELGTVKTVDSAILDWRTHLLFVLTDAHLAAGNRLYQLLWQPVAPYVGETDVLIVPDGRVHSVSFDALSRNAIQADYLIRHHTLSRAYSLTLYAHQLGLSNGTENQSVVGVAPGFSNEDAFLASAVSPRGTLPAQPFAVRMVNELRKRYAAKILLGDRATESGLRAYLEDAGLLVLASHGSIHPGKPLRSGIQLSPDPSADEPTADAAFLSLGEIFGSNIPADISVLTLCESGVSAQTPGATLLSMAYAFTHAGCASTANTLWQIDDQTSSDITTRFISHLADGLPKSQALRQAKLDYINTVDSDLRHPYYWSAMVLEGRDGVVDIPRRNSYGWKYILAGLLLVSLLLFAWKAR